MKETDKKTRIKRYKLAYQTWTYISKVYDFRRCFITSATALQRHRVAYLMNGLESSQSLEEFNKRMKDMDSLYKQITDFLKDIKND